MLINYVNGEECRIAVVEDGKLEELYTERASAESHVGNIYKGRVTNVEPSIQAAFIDFGLERNGFLHISDLHPQYFGGKKKEDTETVGLKTRHKDRPPIQQCLKRGQEVLVQVLKEGIGTKGPTLTSYLSIPGRFIVMMPNMEKTGVSRKVEDEEERREMRKILNELDPPKDFGFIIRTAGMGRNKMDLKRDMAFLQRVWKTIETRRKKINVGELYAEADLLIRTIRDVYTSDIKQMIIDDPNAAKRAQDFLALASPRTASTVMYYNDDVPLFHRYGIEKQIDSITDREVPLPGGGSLVIDSTEALVAIDVNSGKMRSAKDAETTAYKTNIEACDEVCRQLRLRDLGGVVVIDLIDMRETKKRRAIENRFRDNLKNDRARTRINTISQFGLLEMTRQRMRPSLRKSTYIECSACNGLGSIKSPESTVLQVMRELALVLRRKDVSRVELTISPDVAFQVLNRKRTLLVDLEQRHRTPVMVRVNPSGPVDFIDIAGFDERGGRIDVNKKVRLTKPKLIPAAEIPESELDQEMRQAVSPIEEDTAALSDFEEAADETGQELEAEVEAPDDTPTERVDEEGNVIESAQAEQTPEEELEEHLDPKIPSPAATEDEDEADTAQASGDESSDEDGEGDGEGKRKRRRRRRRRRSRKGGEGESDESATTESEQADDAEPDEDKQPDDNSNATLAEQEGVEPKGKRKRKRSRKSKAKGKDKDGNTLPTVISQGDDIHEPGDVNGNVRLPEPQEAVVSDEPNGNVMTANASSDDESGEGKPKRKRKRRRRSKKSDGEGETSGDVSSNGDSSGSNSTPIAPQPAAESSSESSSDSGDSGEDKPKARRSLTGRRKVKPSRLVGSGGYGNKDRGRE